MSNWVGLSEFLSLLNFINNGGLGCFRRKNSSSRIIVFLSTSFLFLFLSFSIYLTLFEDPELPEAYGHFFGTTDTTLNGAQNKTTGNYIVELLLNPSKPMIGKDTSFLMQVKSTTEDVLVELPVSFYIIKDGKNVYSNENNYTIVSQGHHDFNYTFNEPGKYTLFVDIKDIFYTLGILRVNFEIDAQAPILDKISDSIATFAINYYYIYVAIIVLLTLSYAVRLKRHSGVKKAT